MKAISSSTGSGGIYRGYAIIPPGKVFTLKEPIGIGKIVISDGFEYLSQAKNGILPLDEDIWSVGRAVSGCTDA